MTILPILLCGNKTLREKSLPCAKPYSQYKALAENMIETMYKAPGIGLAAPQVGLSIRMFVYDAGKGPQVMINPEILEVSSETCEYDEGCLSVPEISEIVVRPAKIKIKGYGVDGYKIEKEIEGIEARVFQHEYDHLDGILFIDKISTEARQKINSKLKKISQAK
ncbi:MAG: peptide deformylase [Candidatus Wallbacteria bacterium]